MAAKKILVIDDEEHICSFLTDLLEDNGFTVSSALDTEDGFKKAVKMHPDLIILDIQIPQIGGVELCRLIRENPQTKAIPVIMLTVQSSETDKVIGLEIGADDYVTKPFSSKELVARVRSLIRRAGRTEETEEIKVEGLEMNLVSRTVHLHGKPIKLRPKEFDLLHLFLKKPGVVLNRERILSSVFECKEVITTRTIDTHIKNLRQALGSWGKNIKTVFGCGFKFEPKETKK